MLADKPVDAAAADSNHIISSTDDGSAVSNPLSADLSFDSAINPTSLSSSPLSPSSSSKVVLATDAATSESIEMLERVCAATVASVTAIDDVHRNDRTNLGATLHDSSAIHGAADVMQRSGFAAKLFADIARDRFEARLQLLNRKFEVWVEVCIFGRLGILFYALSKPSILVFAFTR
jgi:hypothetical protein